MKKLFYLTKGMLMLTTLGFLITGCSNEPLLDQQEANLKASVSKKSDSDESKKYHFTASLKGSNEVPGNDSKSVGQAVVSINEDETEIHFKLIVANIKDVRMSHFHLGAEGANGQVVAFLFGPDLLPSPNGVIAEGVIKAGNVIGPLAGDLNALIENIRSGNIYVNVHTVAHPGGEIRGNLK